MLIMIMMRMIDMVSVVVVGVEAMICIAEEIVETQQNREYVISSLRMEK